VGEEMSSRRRMLQEERRCRHGEGEPPRDNHDDNPPSRQDSRELVLVRCKAFSDQRSAR
jgi:hypothetical protein